MKALVLALLLLPGTVLAQYENNPAQQALWDYMSTAAPAYAMLNACGRDYTAEFLYNDMMGMAAQLVLNQRDVEITMRMWNQAQAQASLEYYDILARLANSPESDACNQLEADVIRSLGAGV